MIKFCRLTGNYDCVFSDLHENLAKNRRDFDENIGNFAGFSGLAVAWIFRGKAGNGWQWLPKPVDG